MPRKLRDNAHHTTLLLPHFMAGSSLSRGVQWDILCIVCRSIWKSKFWFHWWDRQRQKPDDLGWIKAQLVDSTGATESGEHGCRLHSPPSAVLEGPLQRAGLGPVPCPVRPSRPRASSEVVRPTSPWHDASPASGIRAENSPPIHHSCLPAVLLLHRHFS